MSATASPAAAGAAFAEALAGKDFDRLPGLLADDVDFRALTPNRFWEARGPQAVVDDVARQWLEDGDHVDRLVAVEHGTVGDRHHVGYRCEGHTEEERWVFEQHAYYEQRDGRITWMRVVCSGMRPA